MFLQNSSPNVYHFQEPDYWTYLAAYPPSCQDYYNWGYRTNGNYNLDTDWEEGASTPVLTACDFAGMDASKNRRHITMTS